MKQAILWVVAGIAATLSVVLVATAKAPGAQCAEGFFPVGHRCCPSVSGDGESCGPSRTCPSPLVQDEGECIAPEVRVTVPATHLTVGPSDWEADNVVVPREVRVAPFAIDAFELTDPGRTSDRARASANLTQGEAAALCAQKGGRLPTEDEWIAAAAGSAGTRYPWGETGAVCRRAAWGLVDGPCAHGARGPDTVGSHLTGDTPLGVHDMAGNVSEWTSTTDPQGRVVVVGGSYRSQLASELRVWARQLVDPGMRDPAVGARCAYDLTPLR